MSLTDKVLCRVGCAYLLMDATHVIHEASADIAQLVHYTGTELLGRNLFDAYPELKPYKDRFEKLAQDADYIVRFRIKQADNHFYMVSTQRVSEDDSHLLVLFEDVSTLVLRTEIMGRRIRELESRCLQLEKIALKKEVGHEEQYNTDRGLYKFDRMIERLVAEEGFSRRWHSPLSVINIKFPDNTDQANTEAAIDAIGFNLRAGDILGLGESGGLLLILPHTDITGVDELLMRLSKLPECAAIPDLGIYSSTLNLDGDDTALEVFERAK
ncbi:MAG TPA: hypothetical protein ENI80_09920 [Acidiferrobacteraceae bacterium]|nr:hypothetical protein [Acidiferrobacteraceae bacterium]